MTYRSSPLSVRMSGLAVAALVAVSMQGMSAKAAVSSHATRPFVSASTPASADRPGQQTRVIKIADTRECLHHW